MSSAVDVLAVGELNPDLILSGMTAPAPVLGTEQEFGSQRLVLGSATAICAVALSRLGLRTAMVARVGADDYGRFCIGRLRDEGVDVSGVVIDPAAATGLTVAITYPSDRLLLTLPGAMRSLTAGDVKPAQLDRARHLHVSSYFLQHGLQPGLTGLFDAAHARGLTTSLDTGWDPNGEWLADTLRATLAKVDVVLPNESELTRLGGSADLGLAAAALLECGAKQVAVKRGAAGATLYDRRTEISVAGFPARPVDTTGAGDNFNAGFLFGLLAGWPAERSLRLGNACGAMSVHVIGGVGGYGGMPDVEAFMAEQERLVIEPR